LRLLRNLAAIAALLAPLCWANPAMAANGYGKLTGVVLNLAGTPVDNVSALSTLTGLRSLNLRSTKVIDVTPLANHRSLRELHLGGTRVQDVGALRPLIRNGLRIDRE